MDEEYATASISYVEWREAQTQLAEQQERIQELEEKLVAGQRELFELQKDVSDLVHILKQAKDHDSLRVLAKSFVTEKRANL